MRIEGLVRGRGARRCVGVGGGAQHESGFEMGGSRSDGGRRTAVHHGPRRRRGRAR
jgi:hypothetical protein